MKANRSQRHWRLAGFAGLFFVGVGAILLWWAFGRTGLPHRIGEPPGGGTGGPSPASDAATIISAVAGLVSALGGLISAVAALTVLRRQRRDVAAAGGPAVNDSDRPRLWTPQDGPAWDKPDQRQNRL